MSMRFLDLDHYPRRSHFAYFQSMAYPYVGLTAPMEVTELKAASQRSGGSFFLACLYAASKAANQVPALRQRIVAGRIAEFDHCDTSHTLALDDGTYCYCQMDCRMPFAAFLREGEARQAQAKTDHGIDGAGDETSHFFVSCIPWVTYTALTQPVPYPADSNPRITFGKYEQREGGLWMPVTLLAHHALVDGLHIGQFFSAFAGQISRIAAEAASASTT